MSDQDKDKDKKQRKEYVTKQEKEQFISWYLRKYGYNVNLKRNNSRVLSEAYQQETGIYIPKITIYRWLGKMDNDKVQQKIDKFTSEYVVAELR